MVDDNRVSVDNPNAFYEVGSLIVKAGELKRKRSSLKFFSA